MQHSAGRSSRDRYARLDAIEMQGKRVIMELELIDPMRFFAFKPDSEFMLARAIAAALS
ncbi:MAG: hypothetical protein JOZ12_00030 [Sinobacteraceae bacterium]|nr:hypothetical protein [Nevskiaceae bacterium]